MTRTTSDCNTILDVIDRVRIVLAEKMPEERRAAAVIWAVLTRTSPSTSGWRDRGDPDPHAGRYDCDVQGTLGGGMTDDMLANYVYMDGLGEPDIMPGMNAREFGRESRLMMAKDRIRWLSRAFHRLLDERRDDRAHAVRVAVQIGSELRGIARDKGNVVARRDPNGMGLEHALWMCDQLDEHAASWNAGKIWRWVGYLQGLGVPQYWTALDAERHRVAVLAPSTRTVVTGNRGEAA